jgi:hypothetical protein
MTASPGCWRIYTELGAGGLPAGPRTALVVDAYAVTHPGEPGPQSTPSVWIHLLTLCFALERRWPIDQAVRLRRIGADAFAGWPWLDRPDVMGDVTAADVRQAIDEGDASEAAARVGRWVDGAWDAWSNHRTDVRARADDLTRRFLA